MRKFKTYLPLLLLGLCCHLCNYGIGWKDLPGQSHLCLYAGSVPKNHPAYTMCIGLSLMYSDEHHIKHDITNIMPLPNDSVDVYQAEDVFEHIQYTKLVAVINDIYRVLKPGGLFRLSVPDYRCDILINRSIKDQQGNIIFDPLGGGKYVNGLVVGGGHVWFPIIEKVRTLLEKSLFFTNGYINYLHYYDTNGISVTKTIDYSLGYVSRTPDHDDRVKNPYRCMSMVIDLYKEKH